MALIQELFQTTSIETRKDDRIIPATITRITPKRTKITTDKFGDHDRREKFYEYNYNAEKENGLAEEFCQIRDGVYDLYEFKRKGLDRISDEDLPEVAEHMKAITDILKKYRKE